MTSLRSLTAGAPASLARSEADITHLALQQDGGTMHDAIPVQEQK